MRPAAAMEHPQRLPCPAFPAPPAPDPPTARAFVNTVKAIMGRRQELTAAALFLASAEASYISGTGLIVDGGFLNV